MNPRMVETSNMKVGCLLKLDLSVMYLRQNLTENSFFVNIVFR